MPSESTSGAITDPADAVLVDSSGAVPRGEEHRDEQAEVSEAVQEPAKVMRIGSMVKQLLDEVRSGPFGRSEPHPPA